MSFTGDFTRVWSDACLADVGRVLPLNYLTFDDETGCGEVGYRVEFGDDPIELVDGDTVRIYVVSYKYGEIKNDRRNRN